jgi:hypothetical protein
MAKTLFSKTQAQLTDHIRELALDSSNLSFTMHIHKRMRERKITIACVLSALREGKIVRTPEPNSMTGSLECRMQHYCTGNNVGIIVALSEEDPTLVLVSALIIKER